MVGRPHPLSAVEQRFARALAVDAELGPSFEWNQRIGTEMVSLLWRAGRVVVELDGWDTHGNRYAFARDRQRDHALVLSGHAILRLTHDEILEDAAGALGKVRELVRARRSAEKATGNREPGTGNRETPDGATGDGGGACE